MAILVFPNQVADPKSTFPESIQFTLSSSKGITVESLGANVNSVYFFDTTRPLSGATAFTTNFFRVSSADGTKLRVDNAYNGVQFAVHFKDNSSVIFNATSAAGTGIYFTQTTANNGTGSISLGDLRLWNLNG